MLIAEAVALLQGLELGGGFIRLAGSSLGCFCSVCCYNSLPDCTKPAGSARIAAGQKGLLVRSEKHSSKVKDCSALLRVTEKLKC